MKRIIVLTVLVVVVAGGAGLWFKHQHAAAGATAVKPPDDKAAAEKPAADEGGGAKVTHDEKGNTVINIDDEAQAAAGVVVGNPVAAQWSPEVKGYGRVLDPTALAGLVNELASAQAALAGSSQELTRQKTLSAQNNSSARTLQAAEAAAQHDQLAVQSVRNRLTLAWGEALAGRDDLPAFVQLLITRQAVLVRADLVGGQTLDAVPTGVRLVTLAGKTVDASLLTVAPDVDPQAQGRGFIFSVQPNALALAPGESVTAYLKVPGEPLGGVTIPRDSVVRVEGAGWVYVMNKGGESLTRRKIALDRPMEGGWFVTEAAKPEDYIVVTGAQTLLSEELKAALSPD